MGSCRHNVSVAKGRRIDTRSDQAGIVSHVDHQKRADRMGNFSKTLEIDLKRIGRSASDDEFRLIFLGKAFDFVIVNLFLVIEAVWNTVEILA